MEAVANATASHATQRCARMRPIDRNAAAFRGSGHLRRAWSDARSGRHAVVRGGAELAPGFRGRSEHVRRARASGQHAAGPAACAVTDVRFAKPAQAGKGDRRASGSSCTTLPQKPGPSIRTRIRTRAGVVSSVRVRRNPVATRDSGPNSNRRHHAFPTGEGERAQSMPRRPEHLVTMRDLGL